jgi:hypothetical protein
MFARGAAPGRVHMWCYDESEEDFTKGISRLLFYLAYALIFGFKTQLH